MTQESVQNIVEQVKALLETIPEHEPRMELLGDLQRQLTLLGEEEITANGPHTLMEALRQEVHSWISGELDRAPAAPSLSPDQEAELLRLLEQTRIVHLKHEETERDLFETEVVFLVGGWQAVSRRRYSFARETSTAYLHTSGQPDQEVLGTYDMRIEVHGVDAKHLESVREEIGTTLPLNHLALYLMLVAFDCEVIAPWSPWFDELDFSAWPLRSL